MKKHTTFFKLFFIVSVLYFSPLSYAADKPDFDVSIRTLRNNVTYHFKHEPLRSMKWWQPRCLLMRAKGMPGKIAGLLTSGFILNLYVQDKLALVALRKEHQAVVVDNQRTINESDFQMINESSLYTDPIYSPVHLEKNSRDLRQRVIVASHLQDSIRDFHQKYGFSQLTHPFQYGLIDFFVRSIRCTFVDIKKDVPKLKQAVKKEKNYLQTYFDVNEAIFHFQRRNYDHETPVGSYGLVQSALKRANKHFSILKENEKTVNRSDTEWQRFKAWWHPFLWVRESYLGLTKRLNEESKEEDKKSTAQPKGDTSVDSKDSSELLECQYLIERIGNLQGIVQRRLAETAQDPEKLEEYLNRSLYSFNAVSIEKNVSREKVDVRKANVLSNRGFLLYGWVGDFQRGADSLIQAYELDPHNPFIMMHRALCLKERAEVANDNTEKTELLRKARFFASEATKLAEKNYLIHQVNGQIIYKHALAQSDAQSWFWWLFSNSRAEELERARNEFKVVDTYRSKGDNTLEISTGFDEYYYYEEAQILAALSYREEALHSLAKAKMYVCDPDVKSEGTKKPFDYMGDIIDESIIKVTNGWWFSKIALADIDGPIVGANKRPILIRSQNHIKEDKNPEKDLKKSIEDLLKGLKFAADAIDPGEKDDENGFDEKDYEYILEWKTQRNSELPKSPDITANAVQTLSRTKDEGSSSVISSE
jgi:hypothetical protein